MSKIAPKDDKRLGNSFWKQRMDMSNDGRKLSLEDLEAKLKEYIERCEDNDLIEIDYRGKDLTEVELPKMISMTIHGACAYLGIDYTTWMEWRKDKKYSKIITRAESIFKGYNIEGSAAGFLNSSIIARIEGLSEKIDNTSSDGSMSPDKKPDLSKLSPDELKRFGELQKKIKGL